MRKKSGRLLLMFLLCFMILSVVLNPAHMHASILIPETAWSRDVAAPGYKDGAPAGGFGAGTITWRNDGMFYKRFLTGQNTLEVDDKCGFYFYQKPQSGKPVTLKLNADSLGKDQAMYYSLFPKSWVDYYGDKFLCKAKVCQFSPIIAGDYRLSSYPAAVYEWEITNTFSEAVEVSVMFIWNNSSGHHTQVTNIDGKTYLILRRDGTQAAKSQSETEFIMAADNSDKTLVTYASASNLNTFESDFSADGKLGNKTGQDKTGAIAVKAVLQPGESVDIPIILAWDNPICLTDLYFPHKYFREYTRYFGRSGLNSMSIAVEALDNRQKWEDYVDKWQSEILNNSKYPKWLKTTAFNELYYYFAGGTIWEAGAASGQIDNPDEDMFSHLESFTYLFYGTSDVRFYGSWPLVMFWPEIDKQCVRQFSDSITTERKDRPAPIGTCAHDFGGINTVFTKWNEYNYQDSTQWKDLNSKFVLMVYRDWALTGKSDTNFLKYCWPSIIKALDKVKSQDSDNDGLPNSLGADQTYDNMSLMGNTSYCGGLLLAACEAAQEIAKVMGDTTKAKEYRDWFIKSRNSFEKKLWTGNYYKMDTGSENTRIMLDQLCGQWYAKACGLPDILQKDHVKKAFKTVYKKNFKSFGNGKFGPVNVIYSDGKMDYSSEQTSEVWGGVAWSVAAGMVQEGMTNEAEEIGSSLYNGIWLNEKPQFWFNAPEAWTSNFSKARANYYMRENAVWAMIHAYDIENGNVSNK